MVKEERGGGGSSPSERGVCLPHASFLHDLHVRPEQHAVHGSCHTKVIRLEEENTGGCVIS